VGLVADADDGLIVCRNVDGCMVINNKAYDVHGDDGGLIYNMDAKDLVVAPTELSSVG